MTARANAWTLAAGLASALVALGASADYLPDGKLKHGLTAGGVIGAFILALCARIPKADPDAIRPRP